VARERAVRQLGAWMNGARVGTWTIGQGLSHTFAYAQEWLDSPSARPISLSMPLRPANAPYRGALVESYFDNLLPDNVAIRQRIQARFGAASSRAFDLLAEVGRDCVGAIQLLPEGQAPTGVNIIEAEPLDEEGVAQILRGVPAISLGGFDHRDDFRISLAGAQEKTALLLHQERWCVPRGATPSTHIFKLPMGLVGNMRADFRTSVENEWLCAQLARAFGLEVADCSIATFGDQKALIVTRFDRRLASDGSHWLRLPQEDLCQATGTPPAIKYESEGGPGIRAAMELLLGSSRAVEDRENFFKAQLVFWLLCATDGHGKNFSIAIEPEGRYHLTPLYDILSAYPILGRGANQLPPERARMAMAAISKNRHYEWLGILPRHWDATARACGLSESRAKDLRQSLAAMAPEAIGRVQAKLPAGFPEVVAESIFTGITKAANKLNE
jgi:serine/threonine-protein kinase HipA